MEKTRTHFKELIIANKSTIPEQTQPTLHQLWGPSRPYSAAPSAPAVPTSCQPGHL